MLKIDNFKNAPDIFGDIKKYMAYNYSMIDVKKGCILELGVYKGSSINCIADIVKPEIVHGFDSFEGLPESWEMSDDVTVKAGTFKTKELPKVKKNVELHVGLFNDTIPQWLGENNIDIAMVHIDCDIFSSTIDALTMLDSYIKPGTVIIFDDLYAWEDEDDYPFWRRGQWRALKEWEKASERKLKVVSRMKRRHSAAVLVKG